MILRSLPVGCVELAPRPPSHRVELGCAGILGSLSPQRGVTLELPIAAPSAPQLESPYRARLGKRQHVAVTANEWKTSEQVDHYLELVDTVPHMAEGESVLLEQLPSGPCRILDLGTGDGRLLAHVRRERPESVAVAIDVSEPMPERARERFADQPVEVFHHDLAEPLPDLGRFDGVVSGLAIHHLEDERKRTLYAEGSVL